MHRCVQYLVVLALLNGAEISHGQAHTRLDGMTGLFLISEAEGAISIPVKYVFRHPEPATYSVRPESEVLFSDIELYNNTVTLFSGVIPNTVIYCLMVYKGKNNNSRNLGHVQFYLEMS